MINTLINNRYMVESELGRGGMGIVYRAHDTLLQRDVAVKMLWTNALGSQGRARLLREAQAAARLNHPNIINVFDAGDTDGMSYIVMELLDGDSLYDHRPQSMEEALVILRQVCDALEHAHQNGIIHRDLKPENIIVTSKGIAKLTDFGLSRSLTARISQEGGIVGTVYYLAPEQALRQDVDSRADLYALGVLTYELITGRLPFTADDPLGVISQHLNAPVVPPSTYNPDVPPALDGLVLRLMSKRPEDRPATAAEVRAVLDRVYEEPEEYTTDLLAGLSPLDRLARGRLVGRQDEFGHIKAMWRDVLAGTGPENVLVIGGEPGVGKTPLIKEVRSMAQVSGARVLAGECYPQGGGPFAPIVQILREAQPLPEGIPDLVMADLHALAPDLSSRPVIDKPPLSPLSEQQRLFESLFSLFATLAERQPLALILEDAQWADGSTLTLLRHIARRSRTTHLKLMIVLSYRPDELDSNRPLRDMLLNLSQERLAATIELRPFNREQTRELLSAMFMEAIDETFLDSVYRATEGNLFFIEEICKALIEEGKLYCDGGKWHFGSVEDLALPQSVRMALQVRLNRLPPPALDLLRLASVIGREFDYEVLRLACESPDEDVLIEALEQAERAQLISEVRAPGFQQALVLPQSERFAFAHALIPNTLRDEIGSLRRRRMHRRIAGAIETVKPDDLEALAYHFGQAGDQDKARYYTIRAGDRARKLYANAEALHFYNEALQLTPEEHPDRFHILAYRAQVYDMLAQRDAQRADIEDMLRLAEAGNDDSMRCDALIALADLLLVTENYLVREPIQRAVELARQLGDPVREARALRSLGWNAYTQHDYHESLAALETAVARFRQAGLLSQAAECLHMLSLVTALQGLGELAISRRYAEDAVAVSRLAGDPRQEAIGLRRLAIVYMDQSNYTEALIHAQEALNLHRELGDRYEECLAINNIGVIYAHLGRHQEAAEFFTAAYDTAAQIGSSMSLWIIFANLQWFYYRREGRYEEALAFVDQHLARAEARKDPVQQTNTLVLKAQILYQLGQYPRAMEVLREAAQMADRYTSSVIRGGVRLDIARLHAELGQFREAQVALDEARELGRKFERPNDVAMLYVIDAEISRREWEAGNLKQILRAAEQIEQAVRLLRGTHWTLELAQALQIAAWVALDQDHPLEALEYSDEAMEIYDTYPVKLEGYQYVHICVLWANGRDKDAHRLLERAYQRVMQVANSLQDEAIRKSWLEDVYLNRQIVNDWASEHGL